MADLGIDSRGVRTNENIKINYFLIKEYYKFNEYSII